MLQVIMDEIVNCLYCFLLLTNAALLFLVNMAVMQQPNPNMLLAQHGNSGSGLVLWQKSGSKYQASSMNFLTWNRRAHIMV
jgi:hypothetical protein